MEETVKLDKLKGIQGNIAHGRVLAEDLTAYQQNILAFSEFSPETFLAEEIRDKFT